MLIRSQDRLGFVNINNIDSIRCKIIKGHDIKEHYETEICFFVSGELIGILGKYSTEEKAIKVLDMIQDAYARCESVRTLTAGTVFEIAREFPTEERVNEYKNIHRENFVFQMPEDSEV
jgi:hypothetical protein